jgi:hypothetical protein
VKLAAVSTVRCHPALARHHSTRKEASRNIFAYIEGFYHRTRRHPLHQPDRDGAKSSLTLSIVSEEDQGFAFPA